VISLRNSPVTLDVVEPMGMETMVFFSVNATEICAPSSLLQLAAPDRPCGFMPTSITCT